MTFKNESIQSLVCGTPSVVIENGKFVEKELRKLKFSMNDLMEQLRIENIRNISDVEFAILKPPGILVSFQPVQTRDSQRFGCFHEI